MEKTTKKYRVSWNQRIDGKVTEVVLICTKRGEKFYYGRKLADFPSHADIKEL